MITQLLVLHEVYTNIISILQMRKLGQREELVQTQLLSAKVSI